jgi:hypothetical protein
MLIFKLFVPKNFIDSLNRLSLTSKDTFVRDMSISLPHLTQLTVWACIHDIIIGS